MNDKGFNVVAYNRTTSKVDHFLANEAKGPIPFSVHKRHMISQNFDQRHKYPRRTFDYRASL